MGEMADYQIEQILSGVPGVDICPDCGGDLLGQCECSANEKPARKKRKRGTQALQTTNKGCHAIRTRSIIGCKQ